MRLESAMEHCSREDCANTEYQPEGYSHSVDDDYAHPASGAQRHCADGTDGGSIRGRAQYIPPG